MTVAATTWVVADFDLQTQLEPLNGRIDRERRDRGAMRPSRSEPLPDPAGLCRAGFSGGAA